MSNRDESRLDSAIIALGCMFLGGLIVAVIVVADWLGRVFA